VSLLASVCLPSTHLVCRLRVEAHCARLIQRAFRGFQGRSLWRRLHLRIMEEKRQRSELAQVSPRTPTGLVAVTIAGRLCNEARDSEQPDTSRSLSSKRE
jgi:hypothetical protein